MNQIVLFEDEGYRRLLPLTYWRPVCRLRCGRHALMDLAAASLTSQGVTVGLWVRPELEAVVGSRYSCPTNQSIRPGSLLANQRWIPEGQPTAINPPVVGVMDGDIAFVRCDERLAQMLTNEVMLNSERLLEALAPVAKVQAKGWMVRYPWDLVAHNGDRLLLDWNAQDAVIHGEIHSGAYLLKKEHIHVGNGTVIKPTAVVDASDGPVWIGNNVVVHPQVSIQGPSYIGDHCTILAGAQIRGAVSLGPHNKVGGEVSVSIMHALSNKQHYGFLGHSYLAEWVNIGAGTTTSNMKNTYGTVRVPINGSAVDSGHMFVGSVIGDFAKVGINQSLTTGAVIGFGSSIAGDGAVPQYVPSFRFLSGAKDEIYATERCLEAARKAMARRQVHMSESELSYFRQMPALAVRMEGV